METSNFNQLEDLAFLIRQYCWDLISREKTCVAAQNPWPTLIAGLARVVENPYSLLDFEADGPLYLSSDALGKFYFYSGNSLEELQNEATLLRSQILNLIATNLNDLFSYVTISNRLNTAIDRITMIAAASYYKCHAAELLESAQKDRATNLLHQQAFLKVLDYELLRAKRYRYGLSLLLIEADNFSQAAKKSGLTANQLLYQQAKTLVKTLRTVDVAARFLEKQFAVLLMQTKLTEAKIAAQRLRRAFRQENSLVTVSIGLASYPEKAKNKAELIKAAHLGLTLAQKEGNNVRIY